MTTEVCPTCHQTRALNGACDCEVGVSVHNTAPSSYEQALRATAVFPVPRFVFDTARHLDQAIDITRTVLVPRPDRLPRVDVEGCLCGRPTRDRAFVCDDCLDHLAADLRRVADVDAELETTRVGVQGVDYRQLGGGKGGAKTLPLVIDPTALAARDELRSVLRQLVVSCLQYRVEHTSPRDDVPDQADLPAMAAWLGWRVDAMAWRQAFDTARWDLADALTWATRVAMPTARHFLGPCSVCGTGGMLAATDDAAATCSNPDCRASEPAQGLRDHVLSAYLTDRFYPMADVARLAAWLGGLSTTDTETIRSRLKHWRARGTLLPDASRLAARAPLYRFGKAYGLLVLRDRGTHLAGVGS